MILHIGNILIRMSILVQFPEVIFLFKVRYKCWFAVGEHCLQGDIQFWNSNSFASTETGITQLWQPRKVCGSKRGLPRIETPTQLLSHPAWLRALVTFQNINYYGKGCEVNALYFITLIVQCTSHRSVLNELEIIKWKCSNLLILNTVGNGAVHFP